MTCQQIAKRLLLRAGIRSLDPVSTLNRDSPGLLPGDLDECATAINGAMQELFSEAYSFSSRRREGEILRAPLPVTVDVTQYGKGITITGYATWMLGCTISINGDPLQNEITTATTLLRPHAGNTGSTDATVYSDALKLPSNVKTVLEPVEIPLLPWLSPATDRFTFRSYNQPFNVIRGHRHTVAGNYTPYLTANKQVGIPCVYLMDSFFDESSQTLPIYLRVNPMPQQLFPITFQCTIKPPTITANDITTDNGVTDPATVLPIDFHESTLLPVAMMRFSTHPGFRESPQIVAEIKRQYDIAIKDLQRTRPGISRMKATYK